MPNNKVRSISMTESDDRNHNNAHETAHDAPHSHDHDGAHRHEHDGCACTNNAHETEHEPPYAHNHDGAHTHKHDGCACADNAHGTAQDAANSHGHDGAHWHAHGGCACTESAHGAAHDAPHPHEHDGCACTDNAHEPAHDAAHSHGHDCGHHHTPGGAGRSCCSDMHCGCGGHEHALQLKQLIGAAALFAAAAVIKHLSIASGALFLVAHLLCGKPVVLQAVRNMLGGRLFEEQFLMTAASIAAAGLGLHGEAAAIMLFYQVGEFFQDYAVDKTQKSIRALMDIRPDKATVIRNGAAIDVPAQDVRVGECVQVKAGERIPVDGVIIKGASFVNNAQLTGESAPLEVREGAEVFSGALNLRGLLEIRTSRPAEESAAARIIKLTQESAEKKTRTERFITRFSKVYTPIVCIAALLVATVPALLTGDVRTWIARAIIFLVVSCPCAMVISVPMAFFSGIGLAARKGILLKGSRSIEALANLKTAAFDKTGTLTKGTFTVTEVHPGAAAFSAEELVALAAHAEAFSDHPVSKSLKAAHHGECCRNIKTADAEEMSGMGIRITVDGRTVLAGNEKLMAENHIDCAMRCLADDAGTLVHIAVDGAYAGHIVIADEIKPDAAQAVADLKRLGVRKIVMLTGDESKTAHKMAQEAGISAVYTNLLPEDKVHKIEELLQDLETGGKKCGALAFAGDGINDAPVLSRADVGIAMGALGADAAVEAADVVIMSDEPSKIAEAVRLSKRTLRIVRQNIVLSLGVKGAVMLLGAAGIAGMWLAVFGDVGVAVLAVLNSMRMLASKSDEHCVIGEE